MKFRFVQKSSSYVFMKTSVPSSSLKPIECACALILDQGKILLGLRADDANTYPNVWDIFGGHVEDEETIESALVRELREELDITPYNFDYLTALMDPNPQTNGNYIYHIYKVTSSSGRGPCRRGGEHNEVSWYTLEEALALDLALSEYRDLFSHYIL